MPSQASGFEFGEFLLDPKEKVLRREGKILPVSPKVLDLLLVLVENQGRIVEKDKLMETVWAGSFVEDSNLTFTVSQLRKILGDDAQLPRFIETVPKRGYRFIAEIIKRGSVSDGLLPRTTPDIELSDKGAGAVEQNDLAAGRKASSLRNSILLSSLILISAAIVFASFYWLLGSTKTPTDSKIKFQRLTSNGKTKLAVISPDGRFLAYVVSDEGGQSLWLRNIVAGGDLQVLPPAEKSNIDSVTFSPDGNYIFYISNGALFKLPVLGDEPKQIA